MASSQNIFKGAPAYISGASFFYEESVACGQHSPDTSYHCIY